MPRVAAGLWRVVVRASVGMSAGGFWDLLRLREFARFRCREFRRPWRGSFSSLIVGCSWQCCLRRVSRGPHGSPSAVRNDAVGLSHWWFVVFRVFVHVSLLFRVAIFCGGARKRLPGEGCVLPATASVPWRMGMQTAMTGWRLVCRP